MGNVYSAGPEKNLILYNSGNLILLRTAIAENIGRPVLLANDFAENLTDTVWNGTLYYSYKNTAGDLLIKSITDPNIPYRINSLENPDCFLPSVFTCGQSLIFLYVVKNPLDDSFSVKALHPFEKEKSIPLNEKFSSLPKISVVQADDIFFLHLHADAENKVLKIDAKKPPELLTEEALLTQKIRAPLERELKKRDDLIESIKRQYEELMDTAEKYREEAIKWRRKYYSE